MTVFRPSLPPVSWMTTRMVSRAPGRLAGGEASAVRLRKPGTVEPSATRLPLASEVFRKSRRVGVMFFLIQGIHQPAAPARAVPLVARRAGWVSTKLEFRQPQHQLAQRAHPVVGGILGGPVHGHVLFAGLRRVLQETIAGRRRHIALQEQTQEKVYHVGIGLSI